MDKHRFLVRLNSPGSAGKQVFYIRARAVEDLRELLPEAEIWDSAPEWMTSEVEQRIAAHEYDIDEPFDRHVLTTIPDVTFDRNEPPPGFGAIEVERGSIQRGPEALEQARRLFRER